MRIHLNNNNIIITDFNLESPQISQLKFWGFKKDDSNIFVFADNGMDVDKIILKLIKYFKKENIFYETTKEFADRVNYISERISYYKEFKERAKIFKNGHYASKEFEEFCNSLSEYLPERKLKTHQQKAAFHLYITHNGANFSVPGSGKTSVVLSVYEKLRAEGKVNVLFVVGPPACFGPWKSEFISTLGREPKYCILAGGEKNKRKNEYYTNEENKAELYLTTFHTLINDQEEISILFAQKNINILLVIDEAHYIKKINGNWANATLNIAKYAKYRCVLTGTPIPNSFTDIFNLFDFLWPDNEVISTSSRLKIQSLEKNNQLDKVKDILENSIGPLFYRVRKKDLGLIPANFHEPIIIPMNKYEKIVYEAIKRKIKDYSIKDYLQNIDLIDKLKKGRMTRLRQCVSYLPLLTKAIDNYDEKLIEKENDLRFIINNYNNLEVPAKIEYLTSMVNELNANKQKVVIWTNFIGTIKKLEEHFIDKMNYFCRSIYGETPIQKSTVSDEMTREEIINEFIDPDSGLNILIANPAACAESISLHKTCHNAIYYDLSYNCAQYLQSLDRIHRVGGSEKIEANYYFLQYENSIDKDILFNLRKKADKMSQIIDQDYKIYNLDMFDDESDEIRAYNRIFLNDEKSF